MRRTSHQITFESLRRLTCKVGRLLTDALLYPFQYSEGERQYRYYARRYDRSPILRWAYRSWYHFISLPTRTRRLGYAFLVALLLVGWFMVGIWPLGKVHAASVGPRLATSTSDCTDNSSIGTVTWTTPGNAALNNGTNAATASIGRNAITHYILCQNFGFTTAMIPTGSTINGIVLTVIHTANNNSVVDSAIRVVKGGVIGATDRSTTNPWSTTGTDTHGTSTDLWGTTWAVSDVTASNFGAAVAATNTNSQTKTATVYGIQLTVYYTAPATLTQRHYIFQQDDGANVNSNSTNGSADTALTNVKKGERLNARIQVDNTGGTDFTNGQMSLQYDKNDGFWNNIGQPGTNSLEGSFAACNQGTSCTNVETSGSSDTGQFTSEKIDGSGNAWVSYYDNTNQDLKVAQYVGSGGTGCASSAWTCTTVDSTGIVGTGSSLAFNGSAAWVSYYDQTNGDLKVAQYVGSGGTGCASSAWTCTTVDSTGIVGFYPSLAFNGSTAWISYTDNTNVGLKVAQYVGSGGTGCASTAWTCTLIEGNGIAFTGKYSSLAFNGSTPWISYFDSSNGDLKVAQYVGSGGTGCTASAAWTCTAVDTTGSVGTYTSLSFSGSTAWVSYYDSTNFDLKVAQYVGSGGTGCAITSWTCTTVDSTGDVGQYTSLTFYSSNAWVSYFDNTNGDLKVAKYVGAGGTGCASATWSCITVDSSGTVGQYTSLAFNGSNAWVAYYDATNTILKVAVIRTSSAATQIYAGYGLSGSNGDALTSNVAATCTSGDTFSNGEWMSGSSASKPITIAVSKCTELSFVIDTSQATQGTTYRLRLYDLTDGKALDTYSVYPTLTIVSTANDTIRASKDHIDRLGSPTSCSNTAWDCMMVNSYNATISQYDGRYNGMAFDGNGNPWISSEDNQNKRLVVNQYTPGSAASGQCAANWTCTVVMSDGGTTEYGVGTHIAFDNSGTAWVSFQDYTHKYLYVAQYVGSGGTGCGTGGSTAWTCTKVDGSGQVGSDNDIAVDRTGNPWITYANYISGYLLVAHYSAGTAASGNCAANWVCQTVGTGNNGSRAVIAFDSNNTPYIAYDNFTANTVEIASTSSYAGSACSGTTASWNCGSIVSSSGTVQVSVAVDSNNIPYVGYYDATNTALSVAKYVGGSSGTGCSNSAWTCTIVDNNIGGTTTTGQYPSLAFSPDGTLYASYADSTTTGLKVASNDGNGSGNCTSSAWNCTIVDRTVASVGNFTTLRFGGSGVPWVAYQDATNGDTKVAKLVYPLSKGQLRYKLDNLGYSYTSAVDANLDPLPATAYTPMYRFDSLTTANTSGIQPTWVGQSSVAASTDNIKLQIWRGGTTNAWMDMATNSTCAANTNCTITPTAISSNLSDYYEASGSQYIVRFRVYQLSGSSQTFKTDAFSLGTVSTGPTNDQLMRHGAWFNNGVKQPMTF